MDVEFEEFDNLVQNVPLVTSIDEKDQDCEDLRAQKDNRKIQALGLEMESIEMESMEMKFMEIEDVRVEEKPTRTGSCMIIILLGFLAIVISVGTYAYSNIHALNGVNPAPDIRKNFMLSNKNSEEVNIPNPHNNSWCPNATCNMSPICSPCKRRFLFIIATARSGSTTLLKMMNMLPNIRLSGENNNELFVISNIETNLRGTGILDGSAVDGPWMHNKIPQQAMACPMQKIIETLDVPPTEELHKLNRESFRIAEENKILGVKAIRIQKGKWTPKEASDYFKENFPCSRVIVNYRSNTEDQMKSRENLGWTSKNEDFLLEQNTFLKHFAKSLGENMGRLVDMTEWSQDVSILNEVIDWLGFEDCHFQTLLHENHDGFGRDESGIQLSEQCSLKEPYPSAQLDSSNGDEE